MSLSQQAEERLRNRVSQANRALELAAYSCLSIDRMADAYLEQSSRDDVAEDPEGQAMLRRHLEAMASIGAFIFGGDFMDVVHERTCLVCGAGFHPEDRAYPEAHSYVNVTQV